MVLFLFIIHHSVYLPFRITKFVNMPPIPQDPVNTKIINTKFRNVFLPYFNGCPIQNIILCSYSFEVSYLFGSSGKIVKLSKVPTHRAHS